MLSCLGKCAPKVSHKKTPSCQNLPTVRCPNCGSACQATLLDSHLKLCDSNTRKKECPGVFSVTEEQGESGCQVCLQRFNTGERKVVLRCLHECHEKCLLRRKKGGECPANCKL